MKHTRKKNPLFLYVVEEKQLIYTANYLAHAGNVEQVQHCASVAARKPLELGVAGDPFVV